MKPLVKYQFEAIGTQWSIETSTPLTPQERSLIDTEIEAFDKTYSRFRVDSLVTEVFRNSPGSFVFPDTIIDLYRIYTALEIATDHAVNPLVGVSLEQLGYDAAYSLEQSSDRAYIPPAFATAVRRDSTTLTTTENVLIDIGAIGKGYLVDQLARIITPSHSEYIIDASGDIAVHQESAETIGLEDPHDPSRVIGSVMIHNQSLCASATNRRTWGDGLHHIIDARTGHSAQTDVIATWAIADTTVLADALTTALFFARPKDLQKSFGDFKYVTMRQDGSVEHNIDAIGKLYL